MDTISTDNSMRTTAASIAAVTPKNLPWLDRVLVDLGINCHPTDKSPRAEFARPVDAWGFSSRLTDRINSTPDFIEAIKDTSRQLKHQRAAQIVRHNILRIIEDKVLCESSDLSEGRREIIKTRIGLLSRLRDVALKIEEISATYKLGIGFVTPNYSPEGNSQQAAFSYNCDGETAKIVGAFLKTYPTITIRKLHRKNSHELRDLTDIAEAIITSCHWNGLKPYEYLNIFGLPAHNEYDQLVIRDLAAWRRGNHTSIELRQIISDARLLSEVKKSAVRPQDPFPSLPFLTFEQS